MKKTFKCLSVLLSIVIAFSCVTVAFAADPGRIDYSITSSQNFEGEESATLLLDYVDELLADLNFYYATFGDLLASFNLDKSIINLIPLGLKKEKIDLCSIDGALEMIEGFFGNIIIKTLLPMLGDAKNLKVTSLKGVRRAGGDLNVAYALLNFLKDNSPLFEKVVKGNLSLGSIVNNFFDVNNEINKALGKVVGMEGEINNVTEFLQQFIYAELLYNGIRSTETETDADGNVVYKRAYAPKYKDSGYANVDAVLTEYVVKIFTTANHANKGKPFLASLKPEDAAKITTQSTIYDLVGIALPPVISDYLIDLLNGEQVRKAITVDLVAQGGDLAKLINADYNFTAESFVIDTSEGADLLQQLNAIFGGLFKTLFTDEAWAKVAWVDGNNDVLEANLLNLCKVFIEYAPDTFFGADITAIKAQAKQEDVKLMDLFYKVLQVIVNAAAGMDFTGADDLPSTFGVIGINLLNMLSPNLGKAYDAKVKDAIANKADVAAWVDILMNMIVDAAVYAVDRYTNFDMDPAEVAVKKAEGWGYNEFLDELLDWGINYIGKGVFRCFDSVDPANLKRGEYNAEFNAWDKVNLLVNSLLPLQFINGCETEQYACDFEKVFNDLIEGLTTGDFNKALAAFYRNDKEGNILNMGLSNAVLGLVGQIVNSIIPGVFDAKYQGSVQAFIGTDSLADLVNGLLTGLADSADKMLPVIVPFVLQFLPEIVGRTRLMNSFGSDINGEGIINIKAQVYQSLASNAIGIAKTVEGVDSGEVDDDGNAILEYPAYTGAVEGVEAIGVLLMKTAEYKANNRELTLETAGVKNLESDTLITDSADMEKGNGYYYFKAQITGIKNINSDKDIAVRSYVKLADGTVIYSDVDFILLDCLNF